MNIPVSSIGQVIAIVVLLLAIILGILGHMPWIFAGLFAALAIARLL